MTTNIEVMKFLGDMYGENTYLCINKDTQQAILIDPGTKNANIYLEKNPQVKLGAILLTHGHSDHILYTDFYAQTYQIPIYIHTIDADKLNNPAKNLSTMSGAFAITTKPVTFAGNSGVLTIDDFCFEYQLAAGHSAGQVVYHLVETQIYFVGDTVFEDSIGRYDLPDSNGKAHYDTLNWINTLPENSKLYPGHGRIFLKNTLTSNPVFQMFIHMGV